MKKQNDIIEIAGKEFVVSEDAKKKFTKYQNNLSKKYRFNKKIKNELLSALRDVLSEKTAKKTTAISAKTAQETTEMIGYSYEKETSLTPLINKLDKNIKIFSKKTKKVVLTEKFRKNIYLSLSFIMLIPIGLIISSFNIFAPNYYNDSPINYTAFDTSMGVVELGEYAKVTETNILNNFPTDDSVAYSITVVTILMAVLFYLLSRRSKHTKLVIALLVVSVVGSININDMHNSALWISAQEFNNTLYQNAFPVADREVDDFDKLQACGSTINTIQGGNDDGIFYKLRDVGFKLKSELKTDSMYADPTRAQICTAYNELRTTLNDDSIVLQTYVLDENQQIRPYDHLENASRSSNDQKELKMRYGFFTKE
jgi:multisubunit Na+/H+ antiporter MnhB subunit